MGKIIKPYVIVEKAGLKIGVVGVLCDLTKLVQGDIFNRLPEKDMNTALQSTVDEIRDQCDLVIALTHIGLEEHNPGDKLDTDLAAATRGIDLFIGGHSHTFLEKPVYVKNLDGKKIPIVQDGWAGSYMGEMHLEL
jgi:5'-nucleotidase